MKTSIAKLVDAALANLPELAESPELASTGTTVERTRDPRHGDFATNIAMRLAKPTGSNPRELAGRIIEALPESDLLDKAEIAGPGFINFFVSDAAFR
ncbi:MAG: arginine--tRNA ligase, partial [Gammaproteobacteria bacterium]|nr:arginine--tRNA ligase [Gammaproteobacteria bacterium]